ncbi:hypothetical protein HHI36_003965 [Cryptolaemus montrouzieri]|uniref:Doublecortin domain-containing protein n=1 Tax=Cryptolaemus montrouzieri TaxID=559131 RepID=A0ABD2NQ64_9CUCU
MQGGYLKTKRVHIFVNGRDQYKSFYIHPRCRQGWNAILDCFSRTLKPHFGAVRVLRMLDGRKIDNFDNLEHEGKYVACGLEALRYIKGGYRTTSETNIKLKPTEYYPTELLSLDDQKKYPCLIETMRRGRTIIYVFANGKKTSPKKVVLIKSDYKAWDAILTHIANILDIPEGVRGMYTVFGQPLCSPYEIQHGGYYVAIPFNSAFKQIKYLPVRKTKSYHESSPMITKEAYVSAAKTCTSNEGFPQKRRRTKTTKVIESFHEQDHRQNNPDKLDFHIRIKGIKKKAARCKCAGEGACRSYKEKRSAGRTQPVVTDNHFHPYSVKSTSRSTCESNNDGFTPYGDRDVDISEHEISSTDYTEGNHRHDFTQTSAVFLEATYDQGNVIILKEKKFFLVPEESLRKFSTGSEIDWYTSLAQSIAEAKENRLNEIKEEAGNIVGVVIKASEKIVNRTLFGKGTSMESTVYSILSNTDKPPTEIDSPERRKSALASNHSKLKSSAQEKCLRVSVPIGRISTSEMPIESARDAQWTVPSHSSSQILEVDKAFMPLTPVHDLEYIRESIVDNRLSDRNLPTPFIHMRKDSIGTPIFHRRSGRQMDSVMGEEGFFSKKVRAIPAKITLEGDEYAEPANDEYAEQVNDENADPDNDYPYDWNKLDILDDMGIEEESESSVGERDISDDEDEDRSFPTRMEDEQGTPVETNLEQSKYEGDMYSENLQEIFRVDNDHEDPQRTDDEGDNGLLGLSRESIDQLSLSGEEEESTHSIVSGEMQHSLVDVVEPSSGYDLYASDEDENDVQRPTIGTNYTVSYGSAEETLDLINSVQKHHGGDDKSVNPTVVSLMIKSLDDSRRITMNTWNIKLEDRTSDTVKESLDTSPLYVDQNQKDQNLENCLIEENARNGDEYLSEEIGNQDDSKINADSEEGRRRSILNFLKRNIELALMNFIKD